MVTGSRQRKDNINTESWEDGRRGGGGVVIGTLLVNKNMKERGGVWGTMMSALNADNNNNMVVIKYMCQLLIFKKNRIRETSEKHTVQCFVSSSSSSIITIRDFSLFFVVNPLAG